MRPESTYFSKNQMSEQQEEQSADVDVVYDNWNDKETARLKAQFPAYIAALEGASVTELIFFYDGEGDEGDVYETEIIRTNEVEDLPRQLLSDLQEWALAALELVYSGWQNGDGARGSIHLDVVTQEITVHHSYRVYDFEEQSPTVALTAHYGEPSSD